MKRYWYALLVIAVLAGLAAVRIYLFGGLFSHFVPASAVSETTLFFYAVAVAAGIGAIATLSACWMLEEPRNPPRASKNGSEPF